MILDLIPILLNIKKKSKKINDAELAYNIALILPSCFFRCQVFVILVYISIISFKRSQSKLAINEDKKFYSKFDIKYCIELFHNKQAKQSLESNTKFKRLLTKYVYNWHSNFRFSSRVLNSHVVGFYILYSFFVNWVYWGYVGLSYAEILDLLGKNIIQKEKKFNLSNAVQVLI